MSNSISDDDSIADILPFEFEPEPIHHHIGQRIQGEVTDDS